MAMNNARAPFNNVNVRKAVEYAIDRPAQVRLLGAYAGKRTSQILVPGIPGYKPFNAYPLKGADVSKAKADRRCSDRCGSGAERDPHDLDGRHQPGAGRGVQPEAGRVQDQRRADPGDELLPGDPDQGHHVQLRHERWLVR